MLDPVLAPKSTKVKDGVQSKLHKKYNTERNVIKFNSDEVLKLLHDSKMAVNGHFRVMVACTFKYNSFRPKYFFGGLRLVQIVILGSMMT